MTALRAIPVSVEEPVGSITPDGYLVTNEQLTMLGHGDIKAGRRALRNLIMDERERAPINGPVAHPGVVRLAGPADEQAIYDLLILDLEENASAVAPIDPDTIKERIWLATRHGKGMIGVIDGPDGFPVATIGLFNERWWWSMAWHFCKIWDFVHPDYRQNGYGKELIKFGEWCSDIMTQKTGYRVYTLAGVLGFHRMRDKVRLYKRLTNQVGAFFLYPAPPGYGKD